LKKIKNSTIRQQGSIAILSRPRNLLWFCLKAKCIPKCGFIIVGKHIVEAGQTVRIRWIGTRFKSYFADIHSTLFGQVRDGMRGLGIHIVRNNDKMAVNFVSNFNILRNLVAIAINFEFAARWIRNRAKRANCDFAVNAIVVPDDNYSSPAASIKNHH